jgi:hypothetical protein
MDEDERVKRQNFIHHLREREARKERYEMSEDEKRERRMRERETAEREYGENDAAQAWLVQAQCIEDIRRAEPSRAAGVAAAEPALEVFDHSWVQRHVTARIRDLEARFEARLTELSDAVAENAHAIANAFEEVDRALAKFGVKSNKQLTGALDRIGRQLSEGQHQLMRAINNRIGDAKPVDEAQSTRRGVH